MVKGLMQDRKPKRNRKKHESCSTLLSIFAVPTKAQEQSKHRPGLFKTRNHRHSERQSLPKEGTSPNGRRHSQIVQLLSHYPQPTWN